MQLRLSTDIYSCSAQYGSRLGPHSCGRVQDPYFCLGCRCHYPSTWISPSWNSSLLVSINHMIYNILCASAATAALNFFLLAILIKNAFNLPPSFFFKTPCADWISAVLRILELYLINLPRLSESPDWMTLGTRPASLHSALGLSNLFMSTISDIITGAVISPTPGMVFNNFISFL